MNTDFLSVSRKQFEYYKSLGDKTFAQLSDAQLFVQFNPETNSVATIVKHMWGNMLSRWTDFLHTDGEKEWRKREEEFENDIQTREDMMNLWNEGWDCLWAALDSIGEADLNREIFIRNESHSVMEAISRQLAHYPYHVGQIVFLGKMLTEGNWKSLSIPRGGTAQFNAEKFSNPTAK